VIATDGRQAKRRTQLQIFVVEEDSPVRCNREKCQDLFRCGAEKAPAGLKFKFNLFGNLFCSAPVSKIASRRNVASFIGCPLAKNAD